jgi:hypothetical protein
VTGFKWLAALIGVTLAAVAGAAPPPSDSVSPDYAVDGGSSDAPVRPQVGGIPSILLLQTDFSGLAGFGQLDVSWGGEIMATGSYAYGLADLLQGSPRALELAKPVHHELILADIYSYLGISLGAASTISPVVAFLVDKNPTRTASTVILVSSLAGGLIGTFSTLFGSHYKIMGFKAETDAVNAFNEDLLTGNLKRIPPAKHTAAAAKARKDAASP